LSFFKCANRYVLCLQIMFKLICRYARFDHQDLYLWKFVAFDFRIDVDFKVNVGKSLRSTSNHRKLLLRCYAKKQIMLREKHDQLIIQAKGIMEGTKDTPTKLKKLIQNYFPDLNDFHVNWRCATMEDNSLITIAARYSHLKCLILLVEQFNSSLELCDVGGFTPLILSAYNGSFECVRYCIKKGANASVCGRLRSGRLLLPEHWAILRGDDEIFKYLRATRLRQEAKNFFFKQSSSYSSDPWSKQTMETQLLEVLEAQRSTSEYVQNLPDITLRMQSSGSFCICGQGFEEDMIACDSLSCMVEWFHFACVGLQKEVCC